MEGFPVSNQLDEAWMRTPRRSHPQTSVNVFPVFAIQQPREDEQDGEEEQHESTCALALLLHRLGNVVEEIDEIVNSVVEFCGRHRTRRGDFQAATRIQRLAVFAVQYFLAGQRVTQNAAIFRMCRARSALLYALKIDQHVRHADITKYLVVDAPRTLRIRIEGAQIGVYPIRVATRTRHQRQ